MRVDIEGNYFILNSSQRLFMHIHNKKYNIGSPAMYSLSVIGTASLIN